MGVSRQECPGGVPSPSPTWCLLLQHPSLVIAHQKRRPPNCQTQLLGYWCQFMTVFETMQQEEIKILSPLFLITDCEPSSYEPLSSSWAQFLEAYQLLCSLLHQLRIKAAFLFPSNSVSIFFIWLHLAEKAKILRPPAILVLGHCPTVLPWRQGARIVWILTFSGSKPRRGLVWT